MLSTRAVSSGAMRSRARSCSDAARRLPPEARSEAHARAVRRQGGRRAPLRRPAPRRAQPPLRLPPRAGRGAAELGGAEGRPARARRAAPGGARRGSPARLRRFRGRDPGRAVRRRHGRDLGPGHLRARRGEEGRRAHGPAPRQPPRGALDARAGPPRRQGEELAAAAQGRRLREARLRADARDRHRRPAGRRGLGVRAEVGRVQGPGARRRWRRHLPEPQRQRPHDPLRRGGPRRRPRRALALGGARRRDLRPRRDRTLGVRAAPAGSGRARLRRLRRARGGRRAAHRPHLRASGARRSSSSSTPRSKASSSRRRSTTAPRSSAPRASTGSRASSPS